MEIDDYQKAVLRTEGPLEEPMRRMYDEGSKNQARLLEVCKMLFPILMDVDGFKKSLFYGKPTAYINFADPQFEITEFTCGSQMTRRIHAILGLLTECGELIELMQRSVFMGEQIDEGTWLKEFGDIGWYQALGVDSIGRKLSECAQVNIDKLRRRYPEKFTDQLAQDHDSH